MVRSIYLLLLLIASLRVQAAVELTPHVQAQLVAATQSFNADAPVLVALRLVHERDWHTYWKNPGDSGMPTRITWTLPPGMHAGGILWPAPSPIPVGPLMNYGYHDEVLLLTEISADRGAKLPAEVRIEARAEWLVCKEICLPGGATLVLDLPVSKGPGAASQWAAAIQSARHAVPEALQSWSVAAATTDEHIVLTLRGKSAATELTSLRFFPDDPEIIDNPSPQLLEKTADGYTLKLTAAAAFDGNIKSLSGLLVGLPALEPSGARAASITTTYPGGAPKIKASANAQTASMSASEIVAAADSPTPTFTISIIFALVGGVILNLMPCVFPVVSIKILGFAQEAHHSASRLRAYGAAFAAGVVVCFWMIAGLLIALRASGQALGWGYQLQSPLVVTALAVLFFMLALNLSGVFEFGTRLQSLAGGVTQGAGLRGAFLSGLLATIIATPCTAPFMGAALGYALTRPAWEAMLVFTALAVGMSLPYLILTFSPVLLQRLPKPGRWMDTMKQLLAFPLYLTVVWLVWVLSEQLGALAGAKLMVALVLLAAALWLKSRFFSAAPSRGSARAAAAVLAISLVAGAIAVGWPRGDANAARTHREANASVWKTYSDEALNTERTAGKPVFVDFTAAWCVTCQVNKRLVLESDAVKQAFAKYHVVRMRADWTNRDTVIAAAITRLGRSGVPVYAVYPASGGAPVLLPELLTSDVVINALESAAGS